MHRLCAGFLPFDRYSMSFSRNSDDSQPVVAPPDADRVTDALAALEVPLSRAESHGLACGLLCTQTAAAAKSRWFTELLDAAGLDAGSLSSRADHVRCIDTWFESTQEQIDAPDLVFEPALPPDDVALDLRIDALGDFCAGFTYGVGIGTSGRGNGPLPTDTAELIADFQAIDGVERGPGAGDVGSESDYTELVEYVRVGVLVVLEELKPVDRPTSQEGAGDSPTSPRLH